LNNCASLIILARIASLKNTEQVECSNARNQILQFLDEFHRGAITSVPIVGHDLPDVILGERRDNDSHNDPLSSLTKSSNEKSPAGSSCDARSRSSASRILPRAAVSNGWFTCR